MTSTTNQKGWLTVREVAEQLGFGLTKTKMLVISGEIRSIKHGHHRRAGSSEASGGGPDVPAAAGA